MLTRLLVFIEVVLPRRNRRYVSEDIELHRLADFAGVASLLHDDPIGQYYLG